MRHTSFTRKHWIYYNLNAPKCQLTMFLIIQTVNVNVYVISAENVKRVSMHAVHIVYTDSLI
jgi:hypothetical protein